MDHLDWLGIDCIWLLPFYTSPLRDGGYDISDFFTIQPVYGVLADAVELVEEAHRRGIRVIADLVVNHTSDQHPWFQESRQDRTNPKADWYVWGDDDQRWSEARIIFHDTEASNWTWDPQRQQYYWHRFFHHQPDLNYDNPEVQDAMLDVVRYWLDLGLDGFRLDAVPYLYERDGTNGENLPETHEFLRRLRKEVDATHPGKVLLAEANQWPSDVVGVLRSRRRVPHGFHFPLMPRMYLAAKRGDRGPIESIMAETPLIPEGCQWGLFLRNHDELTLEMVTDAERDEMYAEYAKDPKMRRNTGIARRLAPLLDNQPADDGAVPRPALLAAGQPGPLLRRRDRDGREHPPRRPRRGPHTDAVDARPQRRLLHGRLRGPLPAALMDPVYGYQAVNVEAERRNPGSFLNWLAHDRSRAPPAAGARLVHLGPRVKPAVLAYSGGRRRGRRTRSSAWPTSRGRRSPPRSRSPGTSAHAAGAPRRRVVPRGRQRALPGDAGVPRLPGLRTTHDGHDA